MTVLAVEPLAAWSPLTLVLAALVIVAVPLVPVVWFFQRAVRHRTGGDARGDVARGSSEATPFVLIGWAGAVIAAVVVLAVAVAALAQRATDSSPGSSTKVPRTVPMTTAKPDADKPAIPQQGNAAAGRKLFAALGCGGCHTLAAASARGTRGPSLDEDAPDFETVVGCVTDGPGDMPSFSDRLSGVQIRDLAKFVVTATTGTQSPGDGERGPSEPSD